MLISHKREFIFIHIPKTAGTSVTDVFTPDSRLRDRMAYEYSFSKNVYGILIALFGLQSDGMELFTGLHKHATACEIRDKVGKDIFNSYYKFAFVRNPFDRLVSLYFYILQSEYHHEHEFVSQKSFAEFLNWRLPRKTSSQLSFLIDQNTGNGLVDYIGRFETLENDILFIKEKLNVKESRILKRKNPSLQRKNKNYKEYYDSESICLVEKHFQAELHLLGYTFDGCHKRIPLIDS